MKKIMMIINPAAGRGRFREQFAQTQQLLYNAGFCVTLYFTACRGDATELAAAFGGEYEYLICLGGDGTLSEVVTGLMRLDRRPTVGYFPLGTANDVARTLRLPKNDTLSAAQRFVSGTPTPLDIGMREGGCFVYVAAFGAFTEVSYGTPQDVKQRLGEAAYLMGAAKSLGSLKSRFVSVDYDGGRIEGEYLYGSMSNSRSVAGLIDLPREKVELSDGVHELILVKKPPNAAAFAALAAQVLNRNLDSEYITIEHTKKAVFHFDEPTAWTFDGENGGTHSVISFENIHKAINIIC